VIRTGWRVIERGQGAGYRSGAMPCTGGRMSENLPCSRRAGMGRIDQLDFPVLPTRKPVGALKSRLWAIFGRRA
jgi:hypothetical protein